MIQIKQEVAATARKQVTAMKGAGVTTHHEDGGAVRGVRDDNTFSAARLPDAQFAVGESVSVAGSDGGAE